MECISCKGRKFFKHSSGFLVCDTCFTQAYAPELKSEAYSANMTPRNKRLTIRIKKARKYEMVDSN